MSCKKSIAYQQHKKAKQQWREARLKRQTRTKDANHCVLDAECASLIHHPISLPATIMITLHRLLKCRLAATDCKDRQLPKVWLIVYWVKKNINSFLRLFLFACPIICADLIDITPAPLVPASPLPAIPRAQSAIAPRPQRSAGDVRSLPSHFSGVQWYLFWFNIRRTPPIMSPTDDNVRSALMVTV